MESKVPLSTTSLSYPYNYAICFPDPFVLQQFIPTALFCVDPNNHSTVHSSSTESKPRRLMSSSCCTGLVHQRVHSSPELGHRQQARLDLST